MADALYALHDDPVNKKAWGLYQMTVRRLTIESYAFGTVLNRLTAGCEPEEFEELFDRLAIAFDIFNPAPEPKE